MDAVKLERLLIGEISGVDDPANQVPGWMVLKARGPKAHPILKEHAEGLKLLLTPGEQEAANRIEGEAALVALEAQGIPREVVRRVAVEYKKLAAAEAV